MKTRRFTDAKYVGDPVNAVRIFNDKEVDELILLDICATVQQAKPQFQLVAEIVSECFMPVCYGGGITSLDDISQIFRLGVEKVSINSSAVSNPDLIARAADLFGSQSIVVSIDGKRNLFGRYEVMTCGGRNRTGIDPGDFAVEIERLGAGEILLHSIDRDGTFQGYDLPLIKRVTERVNIPVIASGGAGKLQDFAAAVKEAGASAVAAGSLFVFHGKHRAVLINYPSSHELLNLRADVAQTS